VAGGGDAGSNRGVRANKISADKLELGIMESAICSSGQPAKDTTLGLATVATVVGARAILMRHGS
jgi:hypothetical protein